MSDLTAVGVIFGLIAAGMPVGISVSRVVAISGQIIVGSGRVHTIATHALMAVAISGTVKVPVVDMDISARSTVSSTIIQALIPSAGSLWTLGMTFIAPPISAIAVWYRRAFSAVVDATRILPFFALIPLATGTSRTVVGGNIVAINPR